MRKLLLLLMLFSWFKPNAQTKSRAYKMMLEGMYKHTVPTVSCKELKKEQSQVVLLDTRTKREFEVSHLPEARWVGYEEFDLKKVENLPKNTPIVVYCTVGVRSERIGERLKAAGFQNVRNLYGSIFEWVNQENSVVDTQGKPTQKVHAYSRSWGIWLNKGEKVYE
ncbi:rhodanese-like domain-containing protein [Runella sp. CRIBMP]|uniref:rhodanese-like domain-containing protein n=1 Tax=Runella sp. CRIBMP TaxID=2683261 RepID=UPI001412A62F|nr:rhodanese-like domain-containing protein [Runella sp. CRIBMP]NBB19967.1 rhodanese-like domain-containing protein [Runella sp. CRIBMP]